MTYIPTIGLEIHAELATHSKMFCACKNDPLEPQPNTNICPICMGHPGTLPTTNKKAVQLVQKVGLALGCTITEYSKFDRKSYFYPDLPKGYQISQYDLPFCQNGILQVGDRAIRITRVHLEEDTGKLTHPTNTDYSLVDFNRAGVPLMELVTEPDIANAKEASVFAQELQLLLRYLGASAADMDKGQMRVEANISVHKKGEPFGTKVEVKNLNSFRAVERAIDYEIQRQTALLDSKGTVSQETRGWNETKEETFSQREKESAHDYRYFPEPDLPPFRFTKKDTELLRSELPELPWHKRERFIKEYGITNETFIENKLLAEYFEEVISELGPKLSVDELARRTKLAANYITSDLLGLLQGAVFTQNKITPENFAELLVLIAENKISSAIAKIVLKEMFTSGGDPSQIIETKGLAQITDERSVEGLAQQAIQANPKAVEDFAKGKENALQFLVGQMMALSKGTVSPESARTILKRILTENS